jgi:hypothetical protein
MKKLTAIVLFAGAVAFYTGCGDSATEIQGTLPVVTGIAIDTIATTGDTIFVTWNAMDTTLVEGYFLWERIGLDGAWSLAAVCDGNAGSYIASQSAYYTVMAFNGSNTSQDIGLAVNTKTEGLREIRQLFSMKPVGFRVDLSGDSLIAGDPSSMEFAQQFVVAIDFLSGERYIYPGNAKPEIWPGGARTRISSTGGLVAPAPDDSIGWRDSIAYGGSFFLKLDNGYYCLLDGTHTFPDTTLMTDTLVIDGQVQPIMGVRVFNEQ